MQLPRHVPPRSTLIAWWTWTLVQLVVLAIFAAQWSLSSHFPLPVEDSAPTATAIVQLIFAILLCPVLLADRWSAFRAVAAGAVITVAANALAGRPATASLSALTWQALWLAALTGANPPVVRPLVIMLLCGGFAASYAMQFSVTGWLVTTRLVSAPDVLRSTSTSYHLATSVLSFLLPAALLIYKLLCHKHLTLQDLFTPGGSKKLSI